MKRRDLLKAALLFPMSGLLSIESIAQDDEATSLQWLAYAERQSKAGNRKEAKESILRAARLSPRNGKILGAAVEIAIKVDLPTTLMLQRQYAQVFPDWRGLWPLLAHLAYLNMDFDLARRVIQAFNSTQGPKSDDPNHLIPTTSRLLNECRFQIQWNFQPNDRIMKTPDGWVRIGAPEKSTPRQTATYQVVGDVEWEQVEEVSGSVIKVRWKSQAPFQVVADCVTRPVSRRNLLSKYDPNQPVPTDVQKYLGKTYYVDPNIPRLQHVAREIQSETALGTLENALEWINDLMTYRVEGTPFKTIDDILNSRVGNCTSYSALFASLCRAAGFPAREQWVKISKIGARNYSPGGHSLCEVYIPGGGWIHIEQQADIIQGAKEQIGFLSVAYLTLNRFDDTTGQIWGGTEMMLKGQPITNDLTNPQL